MTNSLQPGPNDTLVPIIQKQDLLAGNWMNNTCHVLIHGIPFQCSFIAKMPNGDLNYYIYPSSLIFCDITDVDALEKEHLYVVHLNSENTIFVEYIGVERSGGNEMHKFTTKRSTSPNMQFSIPRGDIKRIAEIQEYNVNHLIEHII